MKISEVEESGDKIEFVLNDSNEAVANTLRRTILARVETCSVKNIEVVKNQSGLFDEVIANRIGLIPMEIPEGLEPGETATLVLDEQGPKNVKASDFTSGNYDIEPVEDVLLVELKENQELELEANATLGTGKEHSKHQGGTAGYQQKGEGEYHFKVESTSAYSNRELVKKSIQTIKDELKDIRSQIS